MGSGVGYREMGDVRCEMRDERCKHCGSERFGGKREVVGVHGGRHMEGENTVVCKRCVATVE